MASNQRHSRVWNSVLGLASFGMVLVLSLAVLSLFGISPLLNSNTQLSQPGFELVFSEMVPDNTTVWASDPERPEQRHILVKVQHEPFFGIKARLSPDGKKLAYTQLPPGNRNIDSGAALWLADTYSGRTSLLADGVDLRGTPLWSNDGKAILFRRVTMLENNRLRYELSLVDIEQRGTRNLLVDETALGLYPFGWSKHGQTVYYSRVSRNGTDVMALDASSGSVNLVAEVSQGIARDFQLSPDGQEVLFSAPQTPKAGTNYIIGTISIDGRIKRILREEPNDHLSPIWRPGGGRVTYSSSPREVPGMGGVLEIDPDVFVTSVLTTPAGGFDMPLAWTADGQYLAVRALTGDSSQNVTGEKLVVVSPANGARTAIQADGYVEFIGWLAKVR